jgi:putative PIN family toxin of toxin-antitoxin system
MKNKRIILDTNLWISFLISRKLEKLDPILKSGGVSFLFSIELLEEFIEVSKRPKFSKFFAESDVQDILRIFADCGVLIHVKSEFELCRDQKDNFLLGLAFDGKADFLITGDDDLLEIGDFYETKIITWSNFVESYFE